MKLYEKKLFTIADYLMKVHEDKHYIEKVMNQFNSDFLFFCPFVLFHDSLLFQYNAYPHEPL